MSSKKAPAIGIDLGTTYSCVGVYQNGRAEIIANDQGNKITPSCVAFTDTERFIGDSAKSQETLNPENTIFGVKRLIGRNYSDPTVQSDLKYWPFSVIHEADIPKVCVQFKELKQCFSPEEISSMVLVKMKETAETYLGQKVSDAVVTVPAYFNDAQRQATKDAGKIAGLNVIRILNEPTAAALAYGLDKNLKGTRIVLVYDLGGGTFDVSVLNIADGSLFEVLSTAGNTHLGGEDFDNRLVQHMKKEFQQKFEKDLGVNLRSLRRLRTACEVAKRTLSSNTLARIQIDSLFQGIDFCATITRAKFEELCFDLFKKTLETVDQALKDAKINKKSIDDVVLVGGSTRIPKVRKLLTDYFDGKELCMSIHPDEAVAYGAAVQAAVVSGDASEIIKSVLLVEVTPLSLGVETLGRVMTKVIPRNTKIPTKKSQIFNTATDYQTSADFQVFEGERAMTADNNRLGSFKLTGVPYALRGVQNIEVTFDINADGILHVSAECKSSGSFQSIIIKNEKGRLSKDEIDRMVNVAEKYKKEDAIQKERVTIRSNFESFVYGVKHAAESATSDIMSTSEKAIVVEICQEVLQWLERTASKDELIKKIEETKILLSPMMANLRRAWDSHSTGPNIEEIF